MTQPTPKWLLLAVVCISIACSSVGQSSDWMTWPSTYTHDSKGVQVDQHTMPVQPIGPNRDDYQKSAYRHFRSTLQVGQSADNYHVVEQYGRAIEPYEQWRFPYRPYGVPYDAWGPQTPLVLSNNGGFGWNPGFYPPHSGLPPAGTGPGTGTGMTPPTPTPVPPGHYPPGYPGYGYPGNNYPGNGYPGSFPLQPRYQNQPWFDGTYPDAPALDNRTDQQFFWVPPR